VYLHFLFPAGALLVLSSGDEYVQGKMLWCGPWTINSFPPYISHCNQLTGQCPPPKTTYVAADVTPVDLPLSPAENNVAACVMPVDKPLCPAEDVIYIHWRHDRRLTLFCYIILFILSQYHCCLPCFAQICVEKYNLKSVPILAFSIMVTLA